MRCALCRGLSLKIVCKACLSFLQVSPNCRTLGDFKVYTFFPYEEISMLLHAKYSKIGDKVYTLLAQLVLEYLQAKNQRFHNLYTIGIDDRVSAQGYAHNAILLHAFKKVGLIPMYGTLYARNPVSYAGKNLEFRKKNPRNFTLKCDVKKKQIVLIDDIVTTGLTLLEAKEYLESKEARVLYAFALADARL